MPFWPRDVGYTDVDGFAACATRIPKLCISTNDKIRILWCQVANRSIQQLPNRELARIAEDKRQNSEWATPKATAVGIRQRDVCVGRQVRSSVIYSPLLEPLISLNCRIWSGNTGCG